VNFYCSSCHRITHEFVTLLVGMEVVVLLMSSHACLIAVCLNEIIQGACVCSRGLLNESVFGLLTSHDDCVCHTVLNEVVFGLLTRHDECVCHAVIVFGLLTSHDDCVCHTVLNEIDFGLLTSRDVCVCHAVLNEVVFGLLTSHDDCLSHGFE